MGMTQVVEKEFDEYDWMLESYGRKRLEREKKKCREEGEQSGFAKGEQSGFAKGEQSGFAKGRVEGREETSESIAIKLLADNYPLEKISKVTGLDIPRILLIAKGNNQ